MDVEMAKNAGVVSVAVKSGMVRDKSLELAEPDYLIEGFWEIA